MDGSVRDLRGPGGERLALASLQRATSLYPRFVLAMADGRLIVDAPQSPNGSDPVRISYAGGGPTLVLLRQDFDLIRSCAMAIEGSQRAYLGEPEPIVLDRIRAHLAIAFSGRSAI